MQNPRVLLITIALLFFAPLLLAVMMRSGWWNFTPSKLSNRGTLVQPASAFPVDATQELDAPTAPSGHGGWTVVYLLPRHCEQACQKSIAALRQVHLATGRDRDRVGLWMLTSQPPGENERSMLHAIYPGFQLRLDPDGRAKALLAGLHGSHGDSFGDSPGQAFLLDPGGNIILRYAAGFDPRDLRQDLDRLLTWTPGE